VRQCALLFLAVVLATSCGRAPSTSERSAAQLVFLTRGGCANTEIMRANLADALRALGWPADYQLVDLDTLTATDLRRGYPTPTVLYANRDLFGLREPHPPLPEPT